MDYKFLMVLKVIITIYSALLAIGGERGGGGERERERENTLALTQCTHPWALSTLSP